MAFTLYPNSCSSNICAILQVTAPPVQSGIGDVKRLLSACTDVTIVMLISVATTPLAMTFENVFIFIVSLLF